MMGFGHFASELSPATLHLTANSPLAFRQPLLPHYLELTHDLVLVQSTVCADIFLVSSHVCEAVIQIAGFCLISQQITNDKMVSPHLTP
jgi:hypothetical protein